MTRRAYMGPDSTQPEGRAGLSQRLKDRGHVVVLGRIEHRDKHGFSARKASLGELKRDAGGGR